MNVPELLAPAGSPEALDAAIGEGADSVYFGLKTFNARMRSANFTFAQAESAIRSLHRLGRRAYITVNTVFEQREADRMYQLLQYLAALGVDGIIVQDYGVLQMARDNFPTLALHASTQMNIASARGVNALSKHGVSRVILARELSLEEIRGIRNGTNMELEVFVHGSLCISASGLCLFSSFLGGKSANRGQCTQACRRRYTTSEDDPGGYYWSPRDLQLLEYLPSLAEMGINAFKIEGRMKSAEYVGTVVSAYRRALDGLAENWEKSRDAALEILSQDFARQKTAFYSDGAGVNPADFLDPLTDGGTGIALGAIQQLRSSAAGALGFIPLEHPLQKGDSIRLHRADDSDRQSHKLLYLETARNGAWISIPPGFGVGDSVYLIQAKAMNKRYPPLVRRDSGGTGLVPGHDKAPEAYIPPLLQGRGKAKGEMPRGLPQDNPRSNSRSNSKGNPRGLLQAAPFPEGVYVAVSHPGDLYLLQAERPIRVMLAYTPEFRRIVLGKREALPFSPASIILVLDPYFPQDHEKELEQDIPQLMEMGYRQYVLNNLGHFAYFRGPQGSQASLIAGPYCYMFNRWAMRFIASLGVHALISPLENSRQNLERTCSRDLRSMVFVTLFAYPPLFRIRARLDELYDFSHFQDSKKEEFSVVYGQGTTVVPVRPFSIVDKRKFLEDAGFRRFILDFSGQGMKKKEIKQVLTALNGSAPLGNSDRFNWKDGFYAQNESGGAKE